MSKKRRENISERLYNEKGQSNYSFKKTIWTWPCKGPAEEKDGNCFCRAIQQSQFRNIDGFV